MTGRRSVAAARDTRHAILRRAADIGSVEGLAAVSIGRLATDLGMSKAGVIGQFGSKEALQLATIELASEMFIEAVWQPASGADPGFPRLLALCRSWSRYMQDPPFTGGCFLSMTAYEFGAQSGPVHDALAERTRQWRVTLLHDIERAVRDGDLPAGTDPEQVAFMLEALSAGTKSARQMIGDSAAADRCLRAMLAVLGVTPETAAR